MTTEPLCTINAFSMLLDSFVNVGNLSLLSSCYFRKFLFNFLLIEIAMVNYLYCIGFMRHQLQYERFRWYFYNDLLKCRRA